MEIIVVESGLIETNGYLIFDDNTKEAALIDAPQDSSELFLSHIQSNNLKLQYIFLTHTHWDHSTDANRLKNETGAKLCVHINDEYRLLNPNLYSILPLPFVLEESKPDKFLKHDELINVGSIRLQVKHTPGHTEGSLCYIDYEDKIVFSGDTLFNGSVGRVDLPGGSLELLMHSINTILMSLPDDFKVYCGHGISTTIGSERRQNPFLTGKYSEIL